MNNVQHLRYAVEVEKTGSISKAAANFYTGQPRLSKAIRELEGEMNVKIFNRTPRGVFPTPKGKRFLEYAKNIVAQIDELESLYKPSQTGAFSVSAPRDAYVAYAFAKFARLLDDAQTADLKYRETNSARALRDVESGAFNLGVVRFQGVGERYILAPTEERGLKYEHISSFEYSALTSKKHPLAALGSISCADLDRYAEIVYDEDDETQDSFSASRVAQKREKKKKIVVCERGIGFELLAQAPFTYIWSSPVPRETLETYGLAQIKCRDFGAPFSDALVYGENYRLSDMDKLFIKILKETAKELSKGEK